MQRIRNVNRAVYRAMRLPVTLPCMFLAAVLLMQVGKDASTASSRAGDGAADDELVPTTASVDGKSLNIYLSAQRIMSTPEWNPERDAPPVDAQKAHAIARKQMITLVANPDDWICYEVVLQRYLDTPDAVATSHWFWEVCFLNKKNSLESLPLPVYLDGTTGETKPVDMKR